MVRAQTCHPVSIFDSNLLFVWLTKANKKLHLYHMTLPTGHEVWTETAEGNRTLRLSRTPQERVGGYKGVNSCVLAAV
jgi:hypothetical protein